MFNEQTQLVVRLLEPGSVLPDFDAEVIVAEGEHLH
jgi:hypothetical protein